LGDLSTSAPRAFVCRPPPRRSASSYPHDRQASQFNPAQVQPTRRRPARVQQPHPRAVHRIPDRARAPLDLRSPWWRAGHPPSTFAPPVDDLVSSSSSPRASLSKKKSPRASDSSCWALVSGLVRRCCADPPAPRLVLCCRLALRH
jgi:hypothetical protein